MTALGGGRSDELSLERARALGDAAASRGSSERIATLWEDAPGIWGFFSTVDHKRLGMRYIYTAFAFFFLAGLQALLMRVQLATPDAAVVGPAAYNELFTMHGTTMIFLFNTPVFAGFANYLLPLQLGTRDLAFPRLNAFSYWIFLFAGLFMYSSFLTGDIPNGGWFAYAPLTELAYSPGRGIDYWGLGVTFVGISTTVGAVNFIVTIFKYRAPGMTVNRMPLFVWSILAMAFMMIFAVPAVTEASFLLELDRIFGTAFFDTANGGSPLLYQHLFWFWGHPEVYILFLPAVGIMLTTIPVFAGQRLAGYLWAATSLVAIAFISFGVWVHHMFATGMPSLAMGFFSAASQVIAIPSGVLYLCWIATLIQGKVRWTTPMLFSLGFLLIFLMGGLTGVMVSVMPFDWQATDTYFVVAHFHYVLNGAVVFPIFAGIYYWFPKMTGRMLSERLGRLSFWVMFVSFHLAFFPMHILGLLGMPRRVYTYREGFGWGTLNLVVTIGSFLFASGVLLSLVNVVWSRRRGRAGRGEPVGCGHVGMGDHLTAGGIQLPRDPRGAQPSPAVGPRPDRRGRQRRRPRAAGRRRGRRRRPHAPGHHRDGGRGRGDRPDSRAHAGAGAGRHGGGGVLHRNAVRGGTRRLDRRRCRGRGDRLVDVAHVGGSAMTVAGMVDSAILERSSGFDPGRTRPAAFWGMVMAIVTESMLFAGLLSSYFYLRATSDEWPLGGLPEPELTKVGVFSVILIASSLPVIWAERSIGHGDLRRLRLGLALGFVMGAVFLAYTAWDFAHAEFGVSDNSYASVFHITIGLHALHVLAGLSASVAVQAKAWTGRIDAEHHETVRLWSMYWHFVDAVWVVVFTSLYLSPHWS